MLNSTEDPAGSTSLSAWETWLVNKAKEDRLRLEKKAKEASRSFISPLWSQGFPTASAQTFLLIAESLRGNFPPFPSGADASGKDGATRTGEWTKKDCHGTEDARLAGDEARTGWCFKTNSFIVVLITLWLTKNIVLFVPSWGNSTVKTASGRQLLRPKINNRNNQ